MLLLTLYHIVLVSGLDTFLQMDFTIVNSLYYMSIGNALAWTLAVASLILGSVAIFLLRKRSTKGVHATSKEAVTITPSVILDQIIKAIPYAACITGTKGRINHCNIEYIALCNKGRNELYQQLWYEPLGINSNNCELDLSKEGSCTIEVSPEKLLKVSIRPLKIEQLNSALTCIILEDISHHKISLSNIEERKKYFLNLMGKTQLAIIIEDYHGTILAANNAACDLLQMSHAELLSKRMLDFTPLNQRESMTERFEANNTEDNLMTINYLIGKNKQPIPVSINSMKIDFFGTPVLLFIFKSIADKVKLEEEMLLAKKRAEESDRLKSSFLANMSHEIRTPMNSIMGFSELMCDNQLTDKERRDFHNIVKSSANDLLRLIDDIMEFSKLESGIIQIKTEQLNIEQLFNNLTPFMSDLLVNKPDVQYEVLTSPETDVAMVESDALKIEKILRKLLDNAAKFTYKGRVECRCNCRQDGSLEFIVSDTGIGIPKDKHAEIFQRFRQANDDNSRDFGGAGLGLSIASKLTNILGGFIWVDSEEHKGASFHLVIPPFNNKEPKEVDTGKILVHEGNEMPHHLFIKSLPTHKTIKSYNLFELLNIPFSNHINCVLLLRPFGRENAKELTYYEQFRKLTIALETEPGIEIIHSGNEALIGKVITDSRELMELIG